MTKKFSFKYLDKAYHAAAQAFHEDGILKYRVAFQSNLIVFHEVADSIGTSSGSDFVQDVDVDEEALPEELIYSLGYALEEIDFFPGAFWVSYHENEEYYLARLVKNDNSYKMIQCRLPDSDSLQLPIVITKEVIEHNFIWKYVPSYHAPAWFNKVVGAIEEYENNKNQD